MPTTSNADGDTANETVDTKTKKEYKIHPFYRSGNVHFITTDDVIFSCDIDRLASVFVDDKVLGKKVLEFITNDSFFAEGFHGWINRLSGSWGLAVYQAVFKKEPDIECSTRCNCGRLPPYMKPRCYINYDGWKRDLSVSLFGDVKL
ncbi:hypothetical protein L198_07004 [Cryptococcus wingfieldii CBS 7118]|uniref:Uncharacterized protein n=1 Tax=Cryptococcus wingfieldii CBS 7118 TaxID=1295528 RepID=A0A1E3IFK5_9TREE|nr:hypothetical protein L198_07004 [Cryptococcus wingfieldii CBS 7118]ODN87380.1 hypothetical protein L198_07004 [Cryptococcus wingfieldii CBS 7118]